MLLLILCQIATPEWEWVKTFATSSGQAVSPNYGNAITAVDDLNDDGWPDFIIGAVGFEVNGVWRTGIVEVRSGATLDLLYTLTGASGTAFGSALESVGDLDGDAAGDFLVSEGTRFPNRVHVISGRTGITLYSVHEGHSDNGFGNALTRLGDLDSDGIEDFAVGTATEGHAGMAYTGAVWAFSGRSGTLMFQKPGFLASQQFGNRIRGGRRDLDGDRIPDLLVMDTVRGLQGRVIAFSGASQSFICEVNGIYDVEALGSGLDFVADVDGDSYDDFLVGSPFSSSIGFVTLCSGKDGKRLWRVQGTEISGRFGEIILAIPDVTGDGFEEVMVAERAGPGHGRVVILSSVNGQIVSTFEGLPGSGLGDAFAILQRPGQVFPDLMISALSGDTLGPPDAGEVYLFEARPFLQPDALEVSSAVGGMLTLALDFPDTEASKGYQILASSGASGGFHYGGLEIPLVPNACFHSFLHNTPGSFAGAAGTLDAGGNATATLTLAPGALAAWVGHTVKVAAVSLDPNRQPAVVSWARAIQILP